jgi:acetylornithine/succinyldiaminopimelate/putrescine aminotransferase
MGLEIVKSSGIYLIDRTGNRYMDLISGIGVSNTGHRPKRVIQAIRKQIGKYLHTMVYGEYVQHPQVQLAKHLCAHTAPNLNNVFFVNSGSEAIEGALKLAKRYSKRHKIVAMRNAYHGSTHGAMSLMDNDYYSSFYRPLLPEVYFATFNSIESLQIIDDSTACVVVEPIQGEAGYIAANPHFLSALRQKCDETGTLLIFDEIQTAMGRTGSLFAYEQYDVVPDILCLAKAFGAGMPLGAFVSSKEIMGTFTDRPVLGHISTFGGHPVSCAAALENLKWLATSTLINDVGKKETLFRSLLEGHPQVVSISGRGLMLALNLGSESKMKKLVKHALENGLIVDWFLHNTKSIRIAPPLTISNAEIKKACHIIQGGLNMLV